MSFAVYHSSLDSPVRKLVYCPQGHVVFVNSKVRGKNYQHIKQEPFTSATLANIHGKFKPILCFTVVKMKLKLEIANEKNGKETVPFNQISMWVWLRKS